MPLLRVRFCLAVVAFALGCITMGGSASAQGVEQRFEIPSQPLAQALSQFAGQTGLQMLYDAPLAAGRRSVAVSGTMNPRSGLALMLQGTGLSARFTQAGAVVIYASTTSAVTLNPLTAVAAPMVGRRPTDPVFITYADAVRRTIAEAVRTDDALTDAGYRLSIRLWVAANGVPDRAEILSGSGDASRDARFVERARATILPPPPEQLPQPMRIEFSVRPRN